jgi:sensor histidine kinase YesM
MKLSDLLRFQIYDAAQKDWISYVQEKTFLQNYLDLEVMRRDGLSYEWYEAEDDIKDYAIPTFVFLPIIENAIKHSRTSLASGEFININLSTNQNLLILSCSNNIGDIIHAEGSFGLENLKKRLKLLFTQEAPLTIEEKEGIFRVELSLPIDELHNNR